jgi:hypothetical protein
MPSAASSVTCHCGTKFDPPIELKDRHVNCPNCGAVIFLAAAKSSEDDDDDSYGIKKPDNDPVAKKAAGVVGIPDWLTDYKESPNVKKYDRAKTLALIDRLAAGNATLDPLGAALYLACTHADAETSVAALTKVAISGHPVYAQVAVTLLEHVGPSDAAGAQQLLLLLGETRDSAAEQVVTNVVKKLGPTSIIHVRSLIDLLGSRHTALYLWGVQCLKLIGPPAKRAVEMLLKSLKIANHPFRIAVIDALGAIGGDAERVLPVLLQALKHEGADYRAHAAQALGRFGAAASKTAPQLKELLQDKDEGVRKSATKALSLIAAAAKAPAGAAAPPANGQSQEPVVVVCSCGKRLKVKPELAGKKVKCPGCSGVLVVPAPKPAVAEATAATPSSARAVEKECPTCLASVPGNAVLCVCCGFDFRKK